MKINGYKVLMVYMNLDRARVNFSIPSRTVTYSWKPGPIALYFQSAEATGLGISTDYQHSRNHHTARVCVSMKECGNPFSFPLLPCIIIKTFFFCSYNHKISYHLLVTPYKNWCYWNHKYKDIKVENAYISSKGNRGKKWITKSQTSQDKTKQKPREEGIFFFFIIKEH